MLKAVRAWGWYLLGHLHRSHGLWTRQQAPFRRAEVAFSGALRQRPDWPLPCLQRGILHWRELQNPDQAIQDFTRAMAAPKASAEALFLRAMAYEQVGSYHAAADDLIRYLREYPDEQWSSHAIRQLHMLTTILDDIPRQLPPQEG
jgi:regulator of sirC expression with transglutaminase-like and TPR domain